jgi:PAS domain S-box-containing protein
MVRLAAPLAIRFPSAEFDVNMIAEGSSFKFHDTPMSYEAAVAVLEELAAGVSPDVKALVDVVAESGEDGTDAPLLVPVPVLDVTEHWSKSAFHSVIESLPDAIVVIDGDGLIRLVNGQTEKMFGYRRAEMYGWPIELLVPVRFRAGHVGQRNSYLGNPRVRPMGVSLDLFGQRKNGSKFAVEISLSPIESENGTLVASTIRDTTQKKQAEAQLQSAEARYRTLVEEIPAVTFMAALDGGAQELYVSPQIEKLLGFSQKEWLENPILWYTQLHPDDRDRWHTEFARTCSTGEHFLSEYRFLARDGSVVWVHGEAHMVRDAHGRPLFLQGVAFDITDRKNAEEILRKAHDELERQVRERTAELAQQAAELQRSNADLDEFAYVAAHDLKTPARTVNLIAQTLQKRYRDQLSEEAMESISGIITKARWMYRMVEDLYKNSQVGRGTALEQVDCNALLDLVLQNLQSMIEDSNAHVVRDDLPMIVANRSDLSQVFQNLIQNAIKFRSEERIPEIQVSAEREDDDWHFRVKDNAIGIDPQFHSRIFQLSERLSRETEGSGIGLNTCKKAIERRGGRIWVTSKPGTGSTFHFTLPVLEEQRDAQSDQALANAADS